MHQPAILTRFDGSALYHAFFVAAVPFIPRFSAADFHNPSSSGKTRTELIIQRQVRFINDLHNIRLLGEEAARRTIGVQLQRGSDPAFELRYIAKGGEIKIAFIGKTSHSEEASARALCLDLWRKFIAHYPLEDPFNYPVVAVGKEDAEEYLSPIPTQNIASDGVLEIRKYEDFDPMWRNPRLRGYYPHRFMPTFDLSAMGRFLETLKQQDQTCITSIWLRPTRLNWPDIHFIMQRLAEFQPEDVLIKEESVAQQGEANAVPTQLRKGWNYFFREDRHADIKNTFGPIINRRNHLFEFKIQIIGEREAPIDVMEALGSELLGNTFKEEPRLWRYIQPDRTTLGKIKYNFHFCEYEVWDTDSAWDQMQLSKEQRTIAARLSRLVTANEAAGPFRLPIPPASGYLPGIQVRQEPFVAPFKAVAANSSRHITLGTIMHHGQETSQQFLIPIRDLSLHLLIAGATGTGKTNTCLSLLSQLYRRKIPFLVMYPIDKADYRLLMADPVIRESLLIFTVGDETVAPFRFNPFHVAKGILLKTHISALMRCFAAAFSMWDPLPAIYRAALYNIYTAYGWNTLTGRGGDKGTRTPTMSEFYDTLCETTDTMIVDFDPEAQGRVRQSVEIRIRDLLINAGSVVNATDPAPIADILQRPTVMELGRVGSQQDIALIMGFITMLLVEELQSRYKNLTPEQRQQQDLQHVTLIEEAHRIMPAAQQSTASEDLANPAAKGGEDFANMLAEIRGFGEGILIAEQIPVQLVAGAIGNTNMKLMHRLEDQESFRLFTDIQNLSEQQRDYCRGLGPGQVVIRNQDAQPVLVKVDHYLDQFKRNGVGLIIDDSDDALEALMNEDSRVIKIPTAQTWTPPLRGVAKDGLSGLLTDGDLQTNAAQDLRHWLATYAQTATSDTAGLKRVLTSLDNLLKHRGRTLLLFEFLRALGPDVDGGRLDRQAVDAILRELGIDDETQRETVIDSYSDLLVA